MSNTAVRQARLPYRVGHEVAEALLTEADAEGSLDQCPRRGRRCTQYSRQFRLPGYLQLLSAFDIDASATIGTSAPNLPAFEAELSAALTRPDGSIGKLKIDSFERSTSSDDGTLNGRNIHYAI